MLRRPASKKRQGTKSRGGWLEGGSQRLWGFDFPPVMVTGVKLVPSDLDRRGGWLGGAQQGSRWRRGAYQWAIGSLIGVVVAREIAASVEPAQRNGKAATLTGGLAHDVSFVLGVGRHLGSQPRAKTSMTIMRAPQREHGQGATRGASGVASGCRCGSAAGGSAPSSARALAIFAARLALAKSP